MGPGIAYSVTANATSAASAARFSSLGTVVKSSTSRTITYGSATMMAMSVSVNHSGATTPTSAASRDSTTTNVRMPKKSVMSACAGVGVRTRRTATSAKIRAKIAWESPVTRSSAVIFLGAEFYGALTRSDMGGRAS